MIERNGDIFDTDATYIGHGVNCVGVMGKGIAKTIREKFPNTYREYKWVCEAERLKPGGFFVFPEGENRIVNLATQDKPGAHARYDWVFSSLFGFAELASQPERVSQNGKYIAIPEIGCGIGGLEWETVKAIIEAIEKIFPEIEFEVWHYKPHETQEHRF